MDLILVTTCLWFSWFTLAPLTSTILGETDVILQTNSEIILVTATKFLNKHGRVIMMTNLNDSSWCREGDQCFWQFLKTPLSMAMVSRWSGAGRAPHQKQTQFIVTELHSLVTLANSWTINWNILHPITQQRIKLSKKLNWRTDSLTFLQQMS